MNVCFKNAIKNSFYVYSNCYLFWEIIPHTAVILYDYRMSKKEKEEELRKSRNRSFQTVDDIRTTGDESLMRTNKTESDTNNASIITSELPNDLDASKNRRSDASNEIQDGDESVVSINAIAVQEEFLIEGCISEACESLVQVP